MMTVPAMLIAASAIVILVLGSLHLYFTYSGPAFHPRAPGLIDALKADSPRISRETSMWRAATGFHASHSLGAMMFGLIYAYLALESSGFLFHSVFLLALGLLVLLAYLILAKLYWFKVPLRGIALASLLYATALVMQLTS